MGDPFSAAGTAVGITSLGIQTFQILYRYYSDVEGFRKDIDDVLRQVEGLQDILESLCQVKERIEIDNHAPSSQLQLALQACQDALHEVKQMVNKCSTTPQSGGIRAQLRATGKKLLWPYKKETIADLRTNLSKFQDNLHLALQSAGLDGILRKFDDLNATLNSIRNRAANTERALVSQANLLGVVDQNITNTTLAQEHHFQEVSSGLSDLHTQSSYQHAELIHKLDVVASNLAFVVFLELTKNSFQVLHLQETRSLCHPPV
jgi:chromosome segregation ATPase